MCLGIRKVPDPRSLHHCCGVSGGANAGLLMGDLVSKGLVFVLGKGGKRLRG